MFDLYLVLSIFGLFFSIIFSSSELALLSANPLQINVWNQQKKINLLHWTEKILDNKEAMEKALYGDLAFEFLKIEGTYGKMENGKLKIDEHTIDYDMLFTPDKVVCAARFAVEIDICNTCCCKRGIVSNKVHATLLGQKDGPGGKPGCGHVKIDDTWHLKANPRLCKARFGDANGKVIDVSRQGLKHAQKDGIKGGNELPIKLGNEHAKYAQCKAWFGILDSYVRLVTQVQTLITTNSFHGNQRKFWCNPSKPFGGNMTGTDGVARQWCDYMDYQKENPKIGEAGKGFPQAGFFPQGTGCLAD